MGEAGRAGVRALQRGLDVLAEVSRTGGVRAGDIARHLGLPRPTVYRLLETLEELGYVARSASDERFRVTVRARGLGAGFDGGTGLSQVAGPILVELGRRLVWPVDLVTCAAGAMVIQETTHARSPLSIDRGMIGTRLPIMRTAAGRTYLAFCPDPERRALVDHVRRLADPADEGLATAAAIRRLVVETRARGYGSRANSDLPIAGTSATKTSSIGVPILSDSAVLGCLTVIWLARALEWDAAVAQFFPPMQAAAEAIAAGCRGVPAEVSAER
ncbi:MAG TPA: DNA-binding transcriptional regulator [Hyphomicrobiales bacterium]|nr:DNA-binding transcriptional regulator [Hyphomicrobiales bacterium]